MFQGKEFIEGFGSVGFYDFVSRLYDPYIMRMWQVDGANQFASGFTGMGNNPVVGVDPDGQWVQYAVGAVIGGSINLYSNWSKIKGFGLKGFIHGASYFVSGAVGGAVGVNSPTLGSTITAGLNAGVDLATGNVPEVTNFREGLTYTVKSLAIGAGSGFVGGKIGDFVGGGIAKFFSSQASVSMIGSTSTTIIQETIDGTDEIIASVIPNFEFVVKPLVKNASGSIGSAVKMLAGPRTIAKHHVFPNKFRPWFESKGISNIDDYAIEIEHWTNHLKGVHGKGISGSPTLKGGWNLRWQEFIKNNPNSNPSEIFKFGTDLMDEYGFRFSKFIKY